MKLSDKGEISNARATLEEIIRRDADYLPTYFAPEEIAKLSDFANGFDVDINDIESIISEIETRIIFPPILHRKKSRN